MDLNIVHAEARQQTVRLMKICCRKTTPKKKKIKKPSFFVVVWLLCLFELFLS